jgi:RNA polymerase sigma-70 factor (ECF subfamily)
MRLSRDPLANPDRLIRRVYAYAAYRLGDGPEAEDATGDAFERALRYRSSYDRSKGEPAAWMIGIARRCVDETLAARPPVPHQELTDHPSPSDMAEGSIRRLDLAQAIRALEGRDRELIALRYGADLTARQIAALLGLSTNAVEVALTRARARLSAHFRGETGGEARTRSLTRALGVAGTRTSPEM